MGCGRVGRGKLWVLQFLKLCENIERDFFERLNSASEEDDNGAFVKLP